jgi:hypothetical protein
VTVWKSRRLRDLRRSEEKDRAAMPTAIAAIIRTTVMPSASISVTSGGAAVPCTVCRLPEDGADGVGAGDDGYHAEKAKAADIDLCRLTTLYFGYR